MLRFSSEELQLVMKQRAEILLSVCVGRVYRRDKLLVQIGDNDGRRRRKSRAKSSRGNTANISVADACRRRNELINLRLDLRFKINTFITRILERFVMLLLSLQEI